MKVFAVLLSVFALTLGNIIPRIYPGISGGQPTIIEKHPHQVELLYNGEHHCGGSIVNHITIVTAAHCVHGFNQKDITVKVGSTYCNSGQEYEVAEIIEHPDYNVNAKYNSDIAVIKLAKPLTYSNKVQPIELQPADIPVPEGTTAVATGWGSIVPGRIVLPPQLQMVYLDVLSIERCKRVFKGVTLITSSMLCAHSPDKGIYKGESGSPLVANDKLIGIMSWGVKNTNNYPDCFANVSALIEFITEYS